jgi:hypothetical protein
MYPQRCAVAAPPAGDVHRYPMGVVIHWTDGETSPLLAPSWRAGGRRGGTYTRSGCPP